MPFGQETPIIDLSRGWNMFLDEISLPPGMALVAENLSFDELGAMKKRDGYTRLIQKQFASSVKGIVPVSNCFGVQGLLVAHGATLEIEVV